jgi:hypothetical protein
VTANTAACLRPPRKESSLIFPARMPPKRDSSNAVCMNILLASKGSKMGLIRTAPPVSIWLIGRNIMLEIMIIMKRNMTTEK